MVVTARKRSLQRLYFYTCLSFCPGGWWYPSMHCRWFPSMPGRRSPGGGGGIPACLAGFQAHTQRGSLRGSWGAWSWRGLLPGEVCSQGGTWSWGVRGGDPPGWLLLRVVRILLECILVYKKCSLVFKTENYDCNFFKKIS